MCKTESYGKNISFKPKDTIILYFENVNSLPKTKSSFHSDKIISLKHVWPKLNVDLITLVETHVNPSLIPSKDYIHSTIFRNYPATSILSNNVNEVIGRRKKGRVMAEVK